MCTACVTIHEHGKITLCNRRLSNWRWCYQKLSAKIWQTLQFFITFFTHQVHFRSKISYHSLTDHFQHLHVPNGKWILLLVGKSIGYFCWCWFLNHLPTLKDHRHLWKVLNEYYSFQMAIIMKMNLSQEPSSSTVSRSDCLFFLVLQRPNYHWVMQKRCFK